MSIESFLFSIHESHFVWNTDFTETKKQSLLEMGICDPELFYQTDQKVANLAIRLFGLFKERDLHLTYDLKTKKLIAYDSTFSDIHEIKKVFSLKDSKDAFPLFHMQHQTLCATLEDFETTSTGSSFTPAKWTELLKQTPQIFPGNFESISLPSGKTYSQEDFIEHPFFKYTIEKYSVFRFLASFVKKEEFHERYNGFLETILKEDWISFYLSDPKSLACLSILAFLEGQIKKEDLFVIHMVSSALEEATDKEPATFYVLTPENARDYLEEAHYPPFVPAAFYTDKTKEELNLSCLHFIERLTDKTPVQRTVTTYLPSPHSMEDALFLSSKWEIGFKSDNDSKDLRAPEVVILPPLLCLELYEAASSLKIPPPSNHTWMFGYNNGKQSLQALAIGRPVSIASPLFKIPYVHGHTAGKQLGTTMHDIIYHIALDWQNPHVRQFIEIGQTVLQLQSQIKEIKSIGIELLDRAVDYYSRRPETNNDSDRNLESLIAFWKSIAGRIAKCSTSFAVYDQLFPILKDILPSHFFDLKIISWAMNSTKKGSRGANRVLFLKDLQEKIKASSTNEIQPSFESNEKIL